MHHDNQKLYIMCKCLATLIIVYLSPFTYLTYLSSLLWELLIGFIYLFIYFLWWSGPILGSAKECLLECLENNVWYGGFQAR